MEKREIQSGKRYFLSFLIGTLIFLAVFGAVYSISYFEYQRISQSNQELSYSIFKDKLYISFFNKSTCPLYSFDKISEDLRFQGSIINILEKKFGKKDERVLFRKKFYTLVELEHFEFVKQINQGCNKKIPTILFFYSNEKSDSTESEDAGKLLDTVSNKNPNILIYSFDVNLDDDLISSLKVKYNVSYAPTILINEQKKLTGLPSIEQIEQYLK